MTPLQYIADQFIRLRGEGVHEHEAKAAAYLFTKEALVKKYVAEGWAPTTAIRKASKQATAAADRSFGKGKYAKKRRIGKHIPMFQDILGDYKFSLGEKVRILTQEDPEFAEFSGKVGIVKDRYILEGKYPRYQIKLPEERGARYEMLYFGEDELESVSSPSENPKGSPDMYTIADDKTGHPVAMARGQKIKVGQKFKINKKPCVVVKVDRDMVYVTFDRKSYRKNSPANLSGYRKKGRRRRNPPPDPDLPTFRGGPPQRPIYPSQLHRPDYPMMGTQQYPYQVPYYGPPPLAEAPVPAAQPMVFTAVHYETETPIFRVEYTYTPRPGKVEILGGEQYIYERVEGNTIFVRPARRWNYAVLVIRKDTGQAIIFVPAATKRELPRIKESIRRYMKQSGARRGEYQIKTMPFRKITRYHGNPFKLPLYRGTTEPMVPEEEE